MSDDLWSALGSAPDSGFSSDAINAQAGGLDFSAIAKALGQAGGQQQAQKPAVPNLPGVAGVAPPGSPASSAAYSGNPASMNALVQMLMQRVQALRDASNPATARPVNLGGGSRPSGLLGL
jgi:hypothetical protein